MRRQGLMVRLKISPLAMLLVLRMKTLAQDQIPQCAGETIESLV